jgi:hypothetical protein
MIKVQMKVPREKCNTGCYNLLSLKEILSRDLQKEGKGIRNDERCIDCGERRILGQLEGGILFSFPCNFSFRAQVTNYLVESNHVAFTADPL